MDNVITGIELGSDSIKIIVAEYINEKYHILASDSVKSQGIKRGLIEDMSLALESLKKGLDNIEKILGTRIKKAVVVVPSNDRNLSVVESKIDIDGYVRGEDISRVLEEASLNKVPEDYELVSIVPIIFCVNDIKYTMNPNGSEGNTLSVKALLAVAPKKQVYSILKVVSDAKVEVVDISFGSIGDYYIEKDDEKDKDVGAIINIGYNKTNISVFNKGILIKDSIINLGSKNVDKDISYVYEIDIDESRKLKEEHGVATRRFADINENIEFTNIEGKKISITELDLGEVIEARLEELLELSKKEINNLTNRKISYIIVTGGITELMGFNSLVEDSLGIDAKVMTLDTLGVRNNKFSSCMGVIKYYCSKMLLREKRTTMINSEDKEEILNNKRSMMDLYIDIGKEDLTDNKEE